MTGECTIDDMDLYSSFGIIITEDGYNDLLTFPALTEPEKNNWMDEDGIEVDLSNPTLKPREIKMPFFATDRAGASEFMTFLGQPGYRHFSIPALQKEWDFRLTKHSANQIVGNVDAFTLVFVEDKFTKSESSLPTNGIGIWVPQSTYSIDGKYLHEYGVVVNSDLSDFFKMPAIKQNLTQSFFGVDGQEYDTKAVFFSEKEVTFDCTLFAQDVDLFWLQYNTFFNSLVEPGERTLYSDETEQEYPCYYKKSSNFKLDSLIGRVIVSFKLTLVFSLFHVGETEYVLATENDEDIVLEDGETLIDMK